jgi:Ca2+-transporting ATPase
MLFLLVAAGTVNVLLSELLDGMILLFGVFVVITISLYQSRKTEHAVIALRELSSPRALVVRDGVYLRIPGRDVVPGDVVCVVEGDRVPADAVLLDSASLTVDESALTGESIPVRKSSGGFDRDGVPVPGGDGTPWLFSGTLVVKGRGTAVVTATGVTTAFGMIGVALGDIERGSTPLEREVRRLVHVVAVAGLGAAVAVAVIYGVTRGGWLEGALAGLATAMAMLPEEFPLVLTVFLAFGAWRMANRHVLTRRPSAIETLGSATVVCVDKTGTLTTNRIDVASLVGGGRVVDVTSGHVPDDLHELAEFAVLASPVEAFDPIDRAIGRLGNAALAGTEHLHGGWTLEREYPLSDHLLALSHVWRSPGLDRYVVAAKGAPEAIVDLCHLDSERGGAVTGEVEAAASRGERVLAIARAGFGHEQPLPSDHHEFDFEYLGLVGLHDPLRPDAAVAVAECRGAGVRVVMVTGDHAGTAIAIARAAGIDEAGGVLTGPDVAALSDEQLRDRAREVSIFARMVPEQKLRLVRAFQAGGDIVAMTGDGVNDAPALQAAHIGIAMGERGTDVAREAASLVITDDDFASIVDGIRQGRGIFDNLRKAMAYLISVHVVIFGMSLVPIVVSDWPLVLLPVQIAFLELIIDPACSIVFDAEEFDPALMQGPPRPPGQPLLEGRVLRLSALQGGVMLLALAALYVALVTSNRGDAAVRSITFAAVVFGNLILIVVNRSWRLTALQALRQRRNRLLKWMLGGAVAALVGVITVPALRDAFAFGPIGVLDWLLALVVPLTAVSWFELYKLGHAKGDAPAR